MPEPDRERPGGDPPRSLGSRVLRNSAGALLLLAGLGGLFLPVLQCLLMIVGGLLLIDVPQKAKAHQRLLRYGWYRSASDGVAWLWRGWNDLWSDRGARGG